MEIEFLAIKEPKPVRTSNVPPTQSHPRRYSEEQHKISETSNPAGPHRPVSTVCKY